MLSGVHGRLPNASNTWSFSANTPMDPRHLSDDFRDFLISLNDAGVEYLLMGGHAVAHYGYVRPTTDLDVWVAIRHYHRRGRRVSKGNAFTKCRIS